MKKQTIFFIFLSVFYFSTYGQAITASSLINKVVEAVAKVKSYQFTMVTKERKLDNSFHYGKSSNKILVSPYCVYMKIIAEKNNGTEILYNPSKYGKVAVLNAGKFIPDMKLDPFGGILRKDQHHTVLEGGFRYSVDLLYSIKSQLGERFDELAKVESDIMFSDRLCYRISLNYDAFSYEKYVLKDKESLYSLSMQKKISEFLIIYHNKNVSDYSDVQTGKVIEIPNAFAKKAFIYVDKISFHPIGIEMYDEIGMFEKYEFQGVKYNPVFTADEFTKEYDGYGF